MDSNGFYTAPQNLEPDTSKDTFKIIKESWKNYSKQQRLQFAGIIALVLVIPALVGGVATAKFLASRAAPGPVTPPYSPTPIATPSVSFNTLIQNSFDGNGPINLSTWNWSGSTGSDVVLENNQIKLSVPTGSDNVGGNDVVAQPLINSLIPNITGDFEVNVDLVGVNTTNGWEELKFARNGSLSIRRNKISTTETLEVWTSPNNVPSNSTRNVFMPLPVQTSDPLRVKLVKSGNEFLAYYFNGTTFISILDMSYSPLLGDGAPPRLVVENSPSYPDTAGLFDNYTAYVNIISTPGPITSGTPYPKFTATPTAVPKPTASPTTRPTPVSTSTPIAKPTLTPVATATATATATPNNNPTISTVLLPIGRIGKPYKANILGYSLGLDRLSMDINGLPNNLTRVFCSSQIINSRTTINCPISGNLNRSGWFTVKVSLRDSKGNAISRNIPLVVIPF